jgi:ELWxxDGT repeat protein
MVKNIDPTSSSSEPGQMIMGSDGILYFNALLDGKYQLWKCDGTEEGTVKITDLNLNTGLYLPQYPLMVGSVLFYIADDGISGRELWKLSLMSDTNTPEWVEGLFTATPNPVSDELQLTIKNIEEAIESNTIVQIIDLQGRIAIARQWPTSLLPTLRISVNDLLPGIYMAKTISGQRIFTQKIVVVH